MQDSNYFQEYRQDIRVGRLKQLVPEDKRCPLCGSLRLSSKSWVLKPHRKKFRTKRAEQAYEKKIERWNSLQLPKALCKSCFSRVTRNVVHRDEKTYFVWDGGLLASRIEKHGISKAEFAKKTGYSESYIGDLLMQLSFRVHEDAHKIIATSLSELQVPLDDLVRYRFKSDGSEGSLNAERLRLVDGHFELDE